MATIFPDNHPATATEALRGRTQPHTSLGQLARGRSRAPRRRFALAGLVMVVALGYLIFSSFSAAVTSVISPGQLLGRGAAAYGQTVRLQGKVVGALGADPATLAKRFSVSDGHAAVVVSYGSDLPQGFKTGAQVEAQGVYNGRVFMASSLTAKCPTKYQAAPSSASSQG